MSKIGKLWTDSTAYLALIIGAGLSIAGNVADTYRTRGQSTDALDIVMAIAWPALVVLMVHMFVSSRWVGQGWPMQILRWAGTLAIGGMAMLVSWIHLNDLMSSRGQVEVVATCGPLAIDLLAIMATALILAGRRTVSVSSGVDLSTAIAALDTATLDVQGVYSPVDEATGYLARLSQATDSTTTPAFRIESAPTRTMSIGAPKVRVPSVIDAQVALTLAKTGVRQSDYTLGEISELIGGYYGVSGRTIRRQPWWPAVSGRPVSGA